LPDEEDSPDEEGDSDEPFSMQGFSTKVQWLYTQATRLKEQKKVLQRQIKQQRELNSKSDATKDAELAQKAEELKRTTDLLTRTEKDADSTREQLSLMMDKLDEAQQQERLREEARSNGEANAVKQIQEELNQRIAACARLEEEVQDLKDDQAISQAETNAKVSEAEERAGDVTKKLTAAVAAKEAVELVIREKDQLLQKTESKLQELQRGISQRDEELQAKSQTIQAREQDLKLKDQSTQQRDDELKSANEKFQKATKDLEESNMEVARLQTEVTIARAELEGAYGSRAQRAAEATNPLLEKEFEELQLKNLELAGQVASLKDKPADDEKMKVLKKELEETIEEYEQMTKASIEWEKERENLEIQVDRFKDEKEALEAQLSDEKVRWLGMKSPGIEGGAASGGPGGNTSTTVLRNEFRKMMRDTRDGHTKALRVCCTFPLHFHYSLFIPSDVYMVPLINFL
jgi:chromosome segregation ATPase